MNDRNFIPTVAAACGLILFFSLERWLPAAANRHRRLRHAARNLTMGLLNAVAIASLASPFLAHAAAWVEEHRFGLLNFIHLPPAIDAALAILLFDAWMYLWHRANHRFRFLWRFHSLHHSDPEMDVTTTLRFHPGEILISSLLRLAVIPLLGLTIGQLLAYEMLMFPVIMFHHSNVRFPEWLDRRLRVLIVTPAIHRVHHSRLRMETDSNYSSIFSFWDRIAGTFRVRGNGRPVNFGLEEFDGEQWQRISGLLTTPLFFAKAGGNIAAPNDRKEILRRPSSSHR